MLSRKAARLRGSTMPVVPRMEMPSSIPRCGLKVFSARATPSGTEIVTAIFPEKPCAAHTSRTAEVIIARGVALMAAAPTGCSSPGNVTRPTPTPPSTETSDSRAGTPLLPAAPVPDPACSTRAYTSTPSVTSASSPASFRTAHWAHPSPMHASTTFASTGSPPGVTIDTRPTGFRDKSISQAAFAASAAQLPVV